MIGGVSFQPGGTFDQQPQGPKTSPATNVQEAIKILSLRLPKVVGAQAVSPQALLSSPGSGGNPRVDSVVNAVLSKMFPTGNAPAQAPMIPSAPQAQESRPESMPNISGAVSSPVRQQASNDLPPNFWHAPPSIILGEPKPPQPSGGGGGEMPGRVTPPPADLAALLSGFPSVPPPPETDPFEVPLI